MRGQIGAIATGLVLALGAGSAAIPRSVEIDAYNLQLRRAALAKLEEHEPARKADPETLVIFSFDAETVLAGAAVPPRSDASDTIGYVYLSADASAVGAGVYELRLQRSGITVDLVDRVGRVVASVNLDPPFHGAQRQARIWPEAFLTIARWLAPRIG